MEQERDTSYLTHPFIDPDEVQRIKKLVLPDAPKRRRPRVPSLSEIVSRVDLTSAVERAALDEWDQHNFTHAERDVWMDYGLSEYDAALAADCRQAQLPPAALRLDLDGQTVIRHLREGRPAIELVERLRAEMERRHTHQR